MELCKEVQAEEYFIDVVESTDSGYAHLRFSLLASPWFLRPLGLALWSVLHMLLVVCVTLLLLGFFSVVFAAAFSYDALLLCVLMFLLPGILFVLFLPKCIVSAFVWMLLVSSCNIPGRSPDQGLGRYILSAGGLLTPLFGNPQQYPVTGTASLWDALREFRRKALTVRLVTYGMEESFLFWRLALGNLCREIVPLYDTVVI